MHLTKLGLILFGENYLGGFFFGPVEFSNLSVGPKLYLNVQKIFLDMRTQCSAFGRLLAMIL